MRHRRILRQTYGKVPIKHSSTLVDNTGPGVGTIFGHKIFVTNVGARSSSGAVVTLADKMNNEEICRVGDVIKYVNICLQCSPRGAEPTNVLDNAGWLEWAVVFQEERDTLPATTNIGTLTLGAIASHFYRENCLMTGCFPIGTRQAMSQDIKIKLPKKLCRLRQGFILYCICYVRTSLSTDTRTDSHRLIASSHFKSYS